MISLSPKVWLGLLIVLIIGGVVWKMQSDDETIKAQTREIVVKDVTIERQDDTIKVDQIVDTVKETVNTTVSDETGKVTAKVQRIKDKQQTDEGLIYHVFDIQPKTSENLISQTEKLSVIRIGAAWDVFCTADPTIVQCQPVGEPHV